MESKPELTDGPPFAPAGGYVADCTKGIFGRYWIAMVGGRVKCSHMHRSPKAARRCAQQWINWQEKVARYKPHNDGK